MPLRSGHPGGGGPSWPSTTFRRLFTLSTPGTVSANAWATCETSGALTAPDRVTVPLSALTSISSSLVSFELVNTYSTLA